MKVALTTVGSRGDIQPFIALAHALETAGHEAKVVTHPWAKTLVEGYGISHYPVLPDIDVTGHVQELMACSSPLVGLYKGCRMMERSLYSCHAGFLEAVREADIVVGHGIMGSAEADMCGKPFVMIALEPYIVPRKPFASKNHVRNILNELANTVTFQMVGKSIARFRKHVGAPAMKGRGLGRNHRMTLVASSSHLTGRDEFWEQPTEIIGYLYAPPHANYKPPQSLDRFVQRGDVVFVTLGSMVHDSGRAEALAEITTKAVRSVGMRAAILIPGYQGVPETRDIIFIDEAPYAWLLPRVRAIVHHCGFGTAAEALRAGLVSVPIPHLFDQYWRSKELHQKGLASKPTPVKKLTIDTLASSLEHALGDQRLHNRAAQLAAMIQKEEGALRAVKAIEMIGR